MAPTPPLRPQEDGSVDTDRADVLRQAAPIRTAALTAILACAFLLVAGLVGLGQLDSSEPGFLSDALGPEESGAPLERTPAPGVGVRIHSEGYTVSRWGDSVSVVGEDVGGAEWRHHVHGVTRATEFGAETIIVDGSRTEEFFTVTKRQGERTWRWKLATRLVPRLGRDGSVSFLDPTRRRVSGLVVDPVRILDEDGRDITPEGLRWGLEDRGSSWWVTLELDDRDLPLPYVIDPAVTYRGAQTGTTTSGLSLVLNVPAGVQQNDLLVAFYAIGGNRTIVTPAGWTAIGGGNNGTQVETAAFYRIAGGSEPSSYTFTWTGGNEPAAGGMVAYYGVKGTDPLDLFGAVQTANSGTVTAPSITTTAADDLVLAFFGSATNSTYSLATGMNERFESRLAGASSAADDMLQAAAGVTGAKTSNTSVSGRNVGHQAAFKVDDVAPTVVQNDPGSPLAGSVVLDGSASDQDSAVAQVQFQRSPAGAGTWTDVGAADTTSPYSVSFDTTAVADGLYDLRAVATDVAGNTGTATAVVNRRIDNTAPSSTIAFPAASTTYSAAGWNAGCGTSGFCGTYSDGTGSGVSTVQVSIRQGAGNYWSGGSFSSGTEVWDAAGLSAGNWSYAFAAASFPADGSYTVRVRATDAAGNVQTPTSRTFTLDTTAPQTTIDSNPTDPTSSTGADFTFSASEGGSSFECRLDGGAWGACTSPQSYAGLSDGSHTFGVRATDAVGNQDGSPATYTWLVDTAAPSSTVTFPAAAGEYNGAGWDAGCATSGLCGTYGDAGSGVADVEVSIRQGTGDYWDGAAFTSASEVWNAATLAGDWSYAFPASSFPTNGDYTVRARARDAAGNTETAASLTFTVDTAAPQTTIDSTPTDPTGSTGADFEFSASEGGSTFECRLDGGAWGACTSPQSYAGLGDGSHTFDVRAADPAGNTDGTPAAFTWLVDTAAPSSTTSFPAVAGEYNSAGWDAGCATSGLCGTYADGTGSGVQTVEVSIRQGSGDYWDGSAFSSTTEVWNAATLAAGDWSYALDAADLPADGSYTVRVRATDEAGNAETPSGRTFDYDTTDPSALHSFPAAGGEYSTAGWNAGCATTGFCGTYSDATSGVAQVDLSVRSVASGLYWDGDSFDAAGEAFFAAALAGGDWSYAFPAAGFGADGQYTVHVRATDDAGNTEPGPSRTFRIDDTDPSAVYGFPAPGATYSVAGWDAGCAAAGLCGTASDGGSGVTLVELSLKRVGADLYWDGASFAAAGETFFAASLAAGSWSWSFDGADFPADGTYTAHVRAGDSAGNTEPGPVRTFAIDTAAPQTTIDSAPADPTTSTSADFDVSASEGGATFECRLDGGAWGACTSPQSYAGLADGSHTFEVRATDAAGNVDASPASFTWTVDTADPTSAVGFPAAGGEYNGAGWNGGCATSGLCGTYGDGAVGSGVQSVQVSVQRVSTGLYWNGASFSAPGETLLNAALAAGDWSR
ncbi:MAG: Ig-like domain-containing protein, partial [Gaiellaceae bacterium]